MEAGRLGGPHNRDVNSVRTELQFLRSSVRIELQLLQSSADHHVNHYNHYDHSDHSDDT